MSILISFTDRGACIYDESGELCTKEITQHKVLRKCDNCGQFKWIAYGDLVRCRKNNLDYCQKCAVSIKTTKTCLERYGVKRPFQIEEFREKAKQTCLKRYNVENALQSEKIKRRVKQTNLEKYGVEYPLQSEKVKQKSRQTCNKRYGVSWGFETEKCKESASKRASMNLGKRNPNWNPDRHDMEQFWLFRKDVDALSNQNYRKYHLEINPNNFLRGRGDGLYELDHKYSVRQAWDDGIRNPNIVAHWKNLQMLTQKENIEKFKSCSISLQTLLEHCQNDQIDVSLSGQPYNFGESQ